MSCSKVPDSFSRTMEKPVKRAVTMVMRMTATPGIMYQVLLSWGLKRNFTSVRRGRT